MLLREYLQAKGYDADLYLDGEAGYKAFMKSHYDMCLLDVMMPKMDGFSLAQEIRQVNSEVPIIFLTAKNLKEDIFEGFKIGADDYITKPFSMEELTLRMEAILRRVRGKQKNPVAPLSNWQVHLRHQAPDADHRAKSRPSSPRRRANCSHCSASTSTTCWSATWHSRPSGWTTTTSTPAAWMSISPSCASC